MIIRIIRRLKSLNKEAQMKEIRKIFYSQIFSKNDLVFDLGANMGNRTSSFLNIGANVVAVEPNPKLAKRLKKKFKTVTVVDKAIGAKKGKVILYLNESHVLSTTSKNWIKIAKQSGKFDDLPSKFNDEVEVEQITIKELISEYGIPKFIKIDTEGTEFDIINLLDNNEIGCISFEFHEFKMKEPKRKSKDIIKHLNSIGYDNFNISFGESMLFAGTDNMSYQELSNLIDVLPVSWGDIYAFNNK
jgi:FkbM family methyltransferase